MGLVSRQKMLALAVFLAAVTTFMASRFIVPQATAGNRSTTQKPEPPKSVAVARRDIRPLEVLQRDMFRLEKASDHTPKEAIQVRTLAELGRQIQGGIATNFIAKNETLKSADLDDRDGMYALAFEVPAGGRAISVPVDRVSGLAGFLKPGNHVDVLATFDTRRGEAVTRTVVQDVCILAYGREIQPGREEGDEKKEPESGAEPADTATLLVSPAQAERLALAAAKAKLSLALRGWQDAARTASVRRATPGVMEHQVSGVAPEPRTAAPTKSLPSEPEARPDPPAPPAVESPRPHREPPTRRILVIRGTHQELVQVPE